LKIGIIPIGISRRHRYNARFQNSPSEHFITEALMAEYIGFSSEMKSPEDEIVGVRMYNLGGRAASEGILPLRRFAGMQPHRFRHVRLARQAGQRQTLSIRVRSWTTHQRFILESWAPSAGNSPRRRTWRRTEQCRLTRHRSAVAGSRVLEQHQLIRTVCRWSLVAGRQEARFLSPSATRPHSWATVQRLMWIRQITK
jgi:hypothetical protein